jgi:hypothetical protein
VKTAFRPGSADAAAPRPGLPSAREAYRRDPAGSHEHAKRRGDLRATQSAGRRIPQAGNGGGIEYVQVKVHAQQCSKPSEAAAACQ